MCRALDYVAQPYVILDEEPGQVYLKRMLILLVWRLSIGFVRHL
jgi:hypothetical protein